MLTKLRDNCMCGSREGKKISKVKLPKISLKIDTPQANTTISWNLYPPPPPGQFSGSAHELVLIRIIAKKVKTFKTLNISIGIVIVIIYFVTNDQLKVEL